MAPTNLLMVFPRFNHNSFWSLQAACDLYGVRCPAPPLGMMTLAALLPPDWNIRGSSIGTPRISMCAISRGRTS